MNRRDFLKGSAAAMATAGGLARPFPRNSRRHQAAEVSSPQTNLANLDPIWGTQVRGPQCLAAHFGTRCTASTSKARPEAADGGGP